LSNAPSTIASLNAELHQADASLVGNEDVLRAVLAGCGDCIKILDLDGRLQFMSEGGKRVMEVDDFAPLKGCPWPDFWAGEGNAKAIQAIDAARQGRTALFSGAADTAKGTPRYWDVQVSPILGRDGRTSHLLSISRDVTVARTIELGLQEAAARQKLITAEMNHRINNTLALVGAIAAQTLRGDDVEAARLAFTARLGALSDANTALLDSGTGGTSVADVVRKGLEPHLPPTDRVRIAGPDVSLQPKQAMSLALALHELATNAAKYGALSNDSGTVDVVWSVEPAGDDGRFTFRWQERGGPEIHNPTPARKGFGSRLLHAVLPQDFAGTLAMHFAPEGFSCELQTSMHALSAPQF